LFNQTTPFPPPQNQRPPTTRRAGLALIRVGLSASLCLWPSLPPAQASVSEPGVAQSFQESGSLEPGKPIERELSGGLSHVYKVTMTTDQFLRIVVEQRGVDVVVALSTPDGKKIAEADVERVSERTETLSAISELAGAYLIEVRSPKKSAKPGRYEIKLEELRTATAEDRYRVAGEAISREAEQLRSGTETLEAKRKSIEKYHEALELYRRATDRHGEAVTLNSIGAVYWSLVEMRKALEKYNEALPIFQALGSRMEEANTLTNIGVIYHSLGETWKALEKYDEALPIRRAIGDRRGEAITLTGIGKAYHSRGETWKALEKYDEALPISQAVGDRRQEAIILTSIGVSYRSLGEMQKALETYDKSLPIFQALGDRHGEAVTINNIGMIYHSLRETQKALEKYDEALTISQAIGNRGGDANTLNNIGMIYHWLGDAPKALEKFNEALPLWRAVGDRHGEAITLNNIGLAYQSRGEMQKALEKFNEALSLKQAVGDRRGEAVTSNNIGAVYRSLGEMQKALEKFNKALTIFQTAGDRHGKASSLTNIGKVYRLQGETQKALGKYNEALPLWRAVGDRNYEAAALLEIALVEQTRGNLTQALQNNEQAIGLIESLRTGATSQELRASFLASQQDFYQSYIDILMQMHKRDPNAAFDAAAFAASERARARSLLELLAESKADIRQGVDSALLERERFMRRRLNAKAAAQQSLLSRKHTTEQADAAAKEITSITTVYEELRAQIRARSPRYAALTQPQPLNLAEIQQQTLDPDTLLLEYSLGDNASYLFVVSQTSITSYQLPKRDEIDAATRRVCEMLTAPQPRPGETAAERKARIKEARANYWPQAAALSRMLLGPAASQLGAKRLLIVADGALQYLPFGALPSPETGRRGDGATGRDFPFLPDASTPRRPVVFTPLIVNHEIIHLPSASALAVLRRELAGRQPAAKAVAVLADPVFSADDTRVKLRAKAQAGGEATSDLTRAVSDVRGELRRLLMTRDEAETILSVTPRNGGFAALDFSANRNTATGAELSNYRIVHFATHGLLNSEHPELSGLVLSLIDEQGRPQDGFLRMHEIFNLRLPAELVVLSACQTGLGKKLEGEGLVGLTRGFMYAGAARVVASLWEVNDVATAELMKRFYRRMLQDGMRPAAALRAAQIEMWKKPQWQSPFYWGGFILQGEWK
jgi:CHAT domain-containing protein/Tfp pilus assembly protein PilF